MTYHILMVILFCPRPVLFCPRPLHPRPRYSLFPARCQRAGFLTAMKRLLNINKLQLCINVNIYDKVIHTYVVKF